MDCVARQAPLSMGISRQGYWSGLPCPPPGGGHGKEVFPSQGWDPHLLSPALTGGFFTTSATFHFFGLVSKSCLTLRPHGLQHTRLHVHWVGNAIQPSYPLSSPSPSALSLSQNQGLFQWDSSSHHVPEYGSFSFSISPSNEYSGLTSLRTDWFDLFAV